MAKHNGWGVVLASCLGMAVSNGPINTFGFGVFLKPVAADLGFTRGVFSGALGLALLATAVATPFFGAAVDRFGFRRCLLVAIPCHTAAIVMLSFMPASALGIYLMFAATGVLSAGQTPNAYSKAVSVWFDRNRGLALGVATSGVGIGTILVPQYANFLIGHLGWRHAYLGLAAAIPVFAFIPVMFLLREPEVALSRQIAATAGIPGWTRAQAMRSGQFWAIAGAFFIAAAVIVGTLSQLVAMLSDRGFTTGQTATALSVAGAAIIVGRLGAGYALDRIFAPYVTVFFLLCPMAGIALLLHGGTETAVVGTVLLGAAIGADFDIVPFLISRYFGLRCFAQLYGVVLSVFLIGNAIGPVLLGLTFDHTGSYRIMLLAFEPLLALSCILLLRLGPYAFPAGHQAIEAESLELKPQLGLKT